MSDDKQNSYTEDLSFDLSSADAPALFTPSVSSNYVGYASSFPNRVPETRMPKGFLEKGKELNFIDPNNGCWHYNAALTSAGHAPINVTDPDIANEREGMFRNRDKSKTIIIADSGGYQIGTGVLKFDWKNFEGAENNKLRMRILKWMESIADISMTLDVPVWGIDAGIDGVTSFEDCLNKTLWNHDFFIKNRTPGATRFLNILHGRNAAEREAWWDAVKDLPFEGWAVAGSNTSNFETLLTRMIVMRDGGYMESPRDWFHVLGVSKMSSACAYSAIQRAIRRNVNPNFTISYDASSPFLSTAKGSLYTGLRYSPERLSYNIDHFIDSKDLVGSTKPFPFSSPVGRKLTLGDFCVKGHHIDSKSSWDAVSYMMTMNHNCYMHIKGIRESSNLFTLPEPQVRDFIPSNLIEFKDLVDEIFKVQNPDELIKKHGKLFRTLTGTRYNDKQTNAFASSGLFQVEDTTALEIDDAGDDHIFDDGILDNLE